MSYASGHPVPCARKDDLGCPASIPGSKWAQIAAADDGWFFSRQDGAFCPAHNPSWVAGWRARKRDRVDYALERRPAVASCEGCDWSQAAGGGDEELACLRSQARVHAKVQRHRTHVVTSQDSSYTPAELLAS